MRTYSLVAWRVRKRAAMNSTNPPAKSTTRNSGATQSQVRSRANRVERRRTRSGLRSARTTAARPRTSRIAPRRATGRKTGSAKGLFGTGSGRLPAPDQGLDLEHGGLGPADQVVVVVTGADRGADADRDAAREREPGALRHDLVQAVQVDRDDRDLLIDGDVGEALLEAGHRRLPAGARREHQHRPALAGQVLQQLQRRAA